MEAFYFIVIIIAVVLLILILTGVGMLIQKQKGTEIYPPTSVVQKCPDYWTYVDDVSGCRVPTTGVNSIPIEPTTGSTNNVDNFFKTITGVQLAGYSTTGTGATKVSYMNFDTSLNTICAKKELLTTRGNTYIVWDGVTNSNAPCK